MSQSAPEPNSGEQQLKLPDFDPSEVERLKLRQEMTEMAQGYGLTPDQADELVGKLFDKKSVSGFDPEEIIMRLKFARALLMEQAPLFRDGIGEGYEYPNIGRKLEDMAMEQARYLSEVDFKLKRQYQRDDAAISKMGGTLDDAQEAD